MATFWINLKSGNDANAGTFAAPWRTFANGPTAARIAPGDEIRIMRTDVSTLANTTWTNNSANVTIPAGTVLDIDTAVGNTWTVSPNVTGGTSLVRKLGANAQQLTVAGTFTTGKIAYKSTGTLNLSSYTRFSFNLRSSIALVNSALSVRLCSDTLGDTAVHVFAVPAMTSTVVYQFTFESGSALSSSIQSVAIWAETDPGTPAIVINNIIAHNALGLGCLVGPSDSEAFYPVLSISGTTLVLDRNDNTTATGGVWVGTSGTYTMTIRESVFTQNTSINLNEAGSTTAVNLLSGGWQNETTQNGYTIIRNAPFSVNQTMWRIENIGIMSVGSNAVISQGAGVFFTLKNAIFSNSLGTAFSFSNSGLAYKFDNIVVSATGGAFGSAGLALLRVTNSKFLNLSGAVSIGAGWYFENCFFKGQTSASFTAPPPGIAVLKRCEYSGAQYGTDFQFYGGAIVEEDTIGAAYPVIMRYAFGIVRWQTVTKQGSDPGAWEITGVTNSRTQYNPIEFSLGQLLCTSGVAKTVSVWMMKDHATNLQMALFVEGDRLNGVNEAQTIKANDTSWQQVSITFTPTETGVIGIFARVWATASGATGYVGSLTES